MDLSEGRRSYTNSRGTTLLQEAGAEIDQKIVDGLTLAEDQARSAANRLDEAKIAAEGVATASAGIGGALQPGVDAAAALARNFGIALSYAQEIEKRAYERTVGRGRGADPRQFGGTADDIQDYDPAAQLAYQPGGTAGIPLPKDKTARTGRSGGGRGKEAGDPQSVLDSAQREIKALQRRIDLIGKTTREVAELSAKYRLLDEAKRKGLDLDAKQVSTGETLRQQIERQAASIGALTEKYDRASERADFFEQINSDLKDSFLDAIVEGESLSGVLEGLAKSLARAALQAALFGDGPFGGEGSGLLGGIFSSILGGLSGGKSTLTPRASGGAVSAGGAYMVGENGPEPFFPAVNGRILSTSQAQQALRPGVGSAGSGASERATVIRVALSPDLEASILQQARGQSVQITRQGMGEYSTNVAPGRHAQIARDPRRRGG